MTEDDVAENILNERRTGSPSTDKGEVEEAVKGLLRKGRERVVVEQQTAECPDCGTPVPAGAETAGTELDGLDTLVREAVDLSEGFLSSEEVRETLREAVTESLKDCLPDDDLDRAVHSPLSEFSSGDSGAKDRYE